MLPFPNALPDLCIFDWDNTLVDNYAAIHAALNAARVRYGLPSWTIEETRKNYSRTTGELFPQWFGARWQEAQELYYSTFAKGHIEHLTILPGAEEVLRLLAACSVRLAVNSNKKGEYLRRETEYLKWRDYFEAVVGSGDVANGKPSPDGVRTIREKMKISDNASVWFIGDNEVDLKTALAGNCLPIILGNQPGIGHCVQLQDCAELAQRLEALSSR